MLLKKIQRVDILNAIRVVLQIGGICVVTALLIGVSVRWQAYSSLNEIEQELSNQTYLELTSNLQNANCTYQNNVWLEPNLKCKLISYGNMKLTYNALTYNGIQFYYSPFFLIRTTSLFNEFKDKKSEITNITLVGKK